MADSRPEYVPCPIDTSDVELPSDLLPLVERLAESVHDHWALLRMKQGWSWGKERNDGKKEHPCLLPYGDLPESEKEYDRETATQTIKSVLALGCKLSWE